MSTKNKNEILTAIAKGLVNESKNIIEQNKTDLQKARENGIAEVMVDRLMLNEARIKSMAEGVEKIVGLDDPIGIIESGSVRPNGLQIVKTKVPLGVIGIIFESRPNVTVDAAALCVKAGNSVILRGGKEAINSNKILCEIMQRAIYDCGFDPNIVNLVEDTSRETAAQMMRLSNYLDVLIPRGGAGLINAVLSQSTVPVIQTGVGNCHVYVDRAADLEMAEKIVYNAKTSRPSVCNSCESLLVHEDIAKEFLPGVKKALDKMNVEIIGCEKTAEILGDCVLAASDEDYYKEFLDYKISVKVVGSTKEAVEHINKYSSGHSEAIITNDLIASELFTSAVDSAAVYVNASTRFTDGAVFGLGAEIGISTQKLHARGPMGLSELTSIKYIIKGTGQIR